VFSEYRLGSEPPVWCDAINRALPCRYDPEGALRAGSQGPITAKLQIKRIVEEAIAAEPGNLLRVDLVDKGLGGRHRRQR